MKTITTTLVTLAAAVALAGTAGAQATKTTTTQSATQVRAQDTTGVKTDIPPALAKSAKISLDSARAIATKRVANATIESQELERENGRLIYSFDMKVPGKSGITEVNVNALNGHVVGVSHEDPTAEKKEAAAEKKESSKSH